MKSGLRATFLKNLQARERDAQRVRCPICLRDEQDVSLTEGHVYPSLVSAPGGVVPECRECNERLGAFSESDVVHFVRQLLFAHNELPESEFRQLRMKDALVDGRRARLAKPTATGPAIAFQLQ